MSADPQGPSLAATVFDLTNVTAALDDWMRDEPVDTGDDAWLLWNARANVLRTERDYLAARADEARLLVAPTDSLAAGGGS